MKMNLQNLHPLGPSHYRWIRLPSVLALLLFFVAQQNTEKNQIPK